MRNEEYAILVNELQADPLGVGYANMTDLELNTCLTFEQMELCHD